MSRRSTSDASDPIQPASLAAELSIRHLFVFPADFTSVDRKYISSFVYCSCSELDMLTLSGHPEDQQGSIMIVPSDTGGSELETIVNDITTTIKGIKGQTYHTINIMRSFFLLPAGYPTIHSLIVRNRMPENVHVNCCGLHIVLAKYILQTFLSRSCSTRHLYFIIRPDQYAIISETLSKQRVPKHVRMFVHVQINDKQRNIGCPIDALDLHCMTLNFIHVILQNKRGRKRLLGVHVDAETHPTSDIVSIGSILMDEADLVSMQGLQYSHMFSSLCTRVKFINISGRNIGVLKESTVEGIMRMPQYMPLLRELILEFKWQSLHSHRRGKLIHWQDDQMYVLWKAKEYCTHLQKLVIRLKFMHIHLDTLMGCLRYNPCDELQHMELDIGVLAGFHVKINRNKYDRMSQVVFDNSSIMRFNYSSLVPHKHHLETCYVIAILRLRCLCNQLRHTALALSVAYIDDLIGWYTEQLTQSLSTVRRRSVLYHWWTTKSMLFLLVSHDGLSRDVEDLTLLYIALKEMLISTNHIHGPMVSKGAPLYLPYTTDCCRCAKRPLTKSVDPCKMQSTTMQPTKKQRTVPP